MPNAAPATETPAETTETPESTAPETTEKPEGEETPPWGDDFDPARAWKTIQNLREVEKAHKKAEAERERAEKERAEAEKTELQKAEEAVTAARTEALEARRELWTERAARKFEIPDDLLEFLAGDTEEQIQKRAEALAKRIAKDAPAPPATSTRPKPALKAGDSGGETLSADPDAIAKRARARRAARGF